MKRIATIVILLCVLISANAQIDPEFILKHESGEPIEKKHFFKGGYLSKLDASLLKIGADKTGFNYLFKSTVNEAALAGAKNEFFIFVRFDKNLQLEKEIAVDFDKEKVHYAYSGSFANSNDIYLYFTAWNKINKEYYICYAVISKQDYSVTYHEENHNSFGIIKDGDVYSIMNGRVIRSSTGEYNFITAEIKTSGSGESHYELLYIMADSLNNIVSTSKISYTEPASSFSPYEFRLDNNGNLFCLAQVKIATTEKLEAVYKVFYKMLFIPLGADKLYARTIEVKGKSISYVKLFVDKADDVHLTGLYVYPGTVNLQGFFEAMVNKDGNIDETDIYPYDLDPEIFAVNNSDAEDVKKGKYTSQEKVNNMIGWRIGDRLVTSEKNCDYIILEEKASANIEFYGTILIAKISDNKLEWVRLIPKKSSTSLVGTRSYLGYEAFTDDNRLNIIYPDNPKNEDLNITKESIPGLVTQYMFYFSTIDSSGDVTINRGFDPDIIHGNYFYLLREDNFKESDSSYVGMFESNNEFLLVRLKK